MVADTNMRNSISQPKEKEQPQKPSNPRGGFPGAPNGDRF